MNRRVVITGIGMVSPIGLGKEAFWSALLAGRTGTLAAASEPGLPPRRHFSVGEPDYKTLIPAMRLRRMDRFSRLVYMAARLAMDDAALAIDPEAAERAGMIYSTALGPIKSTISHLETLTQLGVGQISSANFANTVTNAALAHVAIDFGLKGVSTALVNTNAIGYGADLISADKADVILVGFCDEVEKNMQRSYGLLNQLACGEGSGPDEAFPFADFSTGCLLGEGAVVAVLEARQHAVAHGRRPIAELLAWTVAHDPVQTFYVARKEPGGAPLARCVGRTLTQAGVAPEQVGYVSGYASGAPSVDQSEANGLVRAGLGRESGAVVGPLKRLIGETLGAAEGFALAEAALVIERGTQPAYVDYPLPRGLPIRVATGGPVARSVHYALANAAKLGGNTQTVLLAHAAL